MGPINTSRKNTTEAKEKKRILVLEPYYGGSHKRFLKELSSQLPYDFFFLTLPARKWKWRMRFSAPWCAEWLSNEDHRRYDAILCSTFVDVAAFRSLSPSWVNEVPVLTYFHENQFAYPVQIEDERDFHFGLTNYTTALASDSIAFNSEYNLRTFLAGAEQMVSKAPDMKLRGVGSLADRAVILHPGLDFSDFPEIRQRESDDGGEPVIVWNHRWEHDKGPETFFQTLYQLSDQGVGFRLIVLGQAFQRRPAIFSEARDRLAKKTIHFDYIPDRRDYLGMLTMGDVIVSTAGHEFYGYAVIEAVRMGCRPVLPDRLSYPELFPAEFLYGEGCLKEGLLAAMSHGRLAREKSRLLTDRFAWERVAGRYRDWIETFL